MVGKKFYRSQYDERIILKNQTNVLFDKSREKILQKAIKNKNDAVIFDDGLQDRNISYDLSIVCFDTHSWIGNNLLIPSGPLREKINSLEKYDCVFLKGEITNKNKLISSIKKINKDIKIFFTYFKNVNLQKFKTSYKYLIFSGIGNPNDFKKNLLINKFNIVKEIVFPDHFNYNKKDIMEIKKEAKKLGAKIITTEKDYVKIKKTDQKNIDFLKVEINIRNEKSFINFLKSKIYE